MRLFHALSLGLVAGAALAAACGDDSGAAAGAGEGDGGGSDAGDAASLEGDDGGSDAAGDPYAIILLVHYDSALRGRATFATAAIAEGDGFGVVARDGACRLFEAAGTLGALPPLLPPPRVTVSGSTLFEGDLVLEPTAANVAEGAHTMVLFYGSEVRVVSAATDALPAIDETIRAPERPVKRTAPSDDAIKTIARSKDLIVEWEAATGVVGAALVIQNGRQITCDFPAEARRGVVPASLLGQLPPGEATIGLTLGNVKRAARGGYRYEIQIEPAALGATTTLE